VDIPNIRKLATNLSPNDQNLDLYTNETSTEFHELLLDLLQKFKIALDELTNHNDNKAKNGLSGKDPECEKIFNRNVHKIHVYGYGLLKLSRGRAFQTHLQNIETYLVDPLRSRAGEEEDSGEERDESDEEGDESDEFDDELEAIQPTLPRRGGLPISYTAWLRLMVAHFDAIEIVVQYIRKLKCNKVSVDILVAPMTDKTLLSWQELFSGPYLPNMDSGTSDIPSQDGIRLFLEEGALRAEALKGELDLAKTACDEWARREHSQATATLKKFHNNSNHRAQVNNILAKIPEGQQISPVTRKVILPMIKELRNNLQEQKDSDRFFSNLENTAFTGTVHCEACLTSLLPPQEFLSDGNEYKDMNILSELQVEYPRFICFCHLILKNFPLVFRAMGRLLECQNAVAPVVGHFSTS
jgi:hypothetical protein